MMDHSSHTVRIVDNGIFPELAVVLARSFGRVEYFSHWSSAEPKTNATLIGKGLEGVERVNSIWKDKDKVDLWVFPDIYDGDVQWEIINQIGMTRRFLQLVEQCILGPMRGYVPDSLIESAVRNLAGEIIKDTLVKEGSRVWGSRNGDELELHRVPSKKVMQKAGIKVGPYATVKGTDELRDYLKGHRDVHVKASLTRGDMESFAAPHLNAVDTRIGELESPNNLGPKAKHKEFVVEDTIDPAIEIGYDGYYAGGFPTKAMIGIEEKSQAYIGHFLPANLMPRQIIRMNEKIESELEAYQYRNFFCIEARITKDGTPWAIDPCCRAGSPPFELGMEMYTNLADILWFGSEGKCVDPVPFAEYGAEVVVHSNWADKNWQPILFPRELRRWVKIKNATKMDGVYYAVPQLDERGTIAAVIGFGKTKEEAVEVVKERAKKVEGYGLSIPVEALDKCLKSYETAKEFGVMM